MSVCLTNIQFGQVVVITTSRFLLWFLLFGDLLSTFFGL